jgi:hypothetical protein
LFSEPLVRREHLFGQREARYLRIREPGLGWVSEAPAGRETIWQYSDEAILAESDERLLATELGGFAVGDENSP